jgi:CHAD domain-containing protein
LILWRFCANFVAMSGAPSEAFTLSWHKKSAESFARILRRLATHAQNLATDGRHSSEQAIHEVRLLIKRVRALLWFARPSLPRNVESTARTQLRKAARILSGQRDLKAAQSTFEKMLEEVDTERARTAVQQARQELHTRNGVPAEQSRQAVEKAVKVFSAEIDHLAVAVEASAKWPSATRRTEKAFRAMRKTGKKAWRSRTDADFHAWRKKTKRLLYLLELRDTDPSAREKRLMERVDELQSTLGDDHDCVVAEKQVPAAPGERDVSRTVTRLLDERKRRLRKKSRKLARRIEAVA